MYYQLCFLHSCCISYLECHLPTDDLLPQISPLGAGGLLPVPTPHWVHCSLTYVSTEFIGVLPSNGYHLCGIVQQVILPLSTVSSRRTGIRSALSLALEKPTMFIESRRILHISYTLWYSDNGLKFKRISKMMGLGKRLNVLLPCSYLQFRSDFW